MYPWLHLTSSVPVEVRIASSLLWLEGNSKLVLAVI